MQLFFCLRQSKVNKQTNETTHESTKETTNTVIDPISQYINTEFGVLPGQVFFTSNPLYNIILFVAWWPWGNDGHVSMRVGLIPWNNARFKENFSYECLKRWLPIAVDEAGEISVASRPSEIS